MADVAPRSSPTVLTLGVACLAAIAEGMTFTNHAPLLPLIIHDLQISPMQAGLLSTSMFLTGGCLAFPLGTMVDRLGARPVHAAVMLVLIVSNGSFAFVSSYGALLVLKAFSGVGVTGSFVVGGQYVNAVFSDRHLFLAQGLYGGSILFGSGLAVFALPLVAAALGSWRLALASCAMPLALAVTLWLAAARTTPRVPRPSGSSVWSNLTVWQMGLTNMAMFGLSIIFGTWVSVYLVHEFGLALSNAAAIGSVSLLLAVIGRPLGGILLVRGIWSARSAILSTLVATTLAVLVLAVPRRPLALAVLAVVSLGMSMSLGYSANIVLASRACPEAAGTALGLVGMMSTLGVVVGAPLIGALFSMAHSFSLPFGVLALLPAAAFAACLSLP